MSASGRKKLSPDAEEIIKVCKRPRRYDLGMEHLPGGRVRMVAKEKPRNKRGMGNILGLSALFGGSTGDGKVNIADPSYKQKNVQFQPQSPFEAEHMGKAQVVHFIPNFVGPIAPLSARAATMLANRYPDVFGADQADRGLAALMLTMDEQKFINDRPLDVSEHLDLWNRIQDIKAELLGRSERFLVKKGPVVDADGTEREQLIVELNAEREAGEPVEISTGEIIWPLVFDLVQAPETPAWVENLVNERELRATERATNKMRDFMAIGLCMMFVFIGIGVMLNLMGKGGGISMPHLPI